MRQDLHNYIYPRPPNVNGHPIVALADELQALRATKPRTFDAWLEVADEEDRATVLEAINDRSLLPNSLAVVLRRNGVPVTRETILNIRDQRDAQN